MDNFDGIVPFNLLTGVPSVGFGSSAYVTGIAISGTYGIIGYSNNTASQTFNPDTLTITGSIETLYYVTGITASGTTGLASTSDGSIYALDIAMPSVKAICSLIAYPSGLAINGTTGIVASSSDNQIYFLDLSVHGTIPIVGTMITGLYPQGLAFQGTTGVVANTHDNTISIFVYTPSPSFPTYPGNAGVTANLLNIINGSCPADTQNLIDEMLGFSGSDQEAALNSFTPQFKVIQFSLEKLNFLIQRELQDIQYRFQKGFRPFMIAGYDYMQQKPFGPYTGYNVENFYQFLGFSHCEDSSKFMMGAGASESRMKLKPLHANASYVTTYGSFGMSAQGEHFLGGIQGLFGYSFINTSRYMDLLGLNATSSHGAWNASAESRIAYKIHDDFYTFQPYDNLGYIYGRENKYTEVGAPGANFTVFNENISMIRNSLGFLLDLPRNKAVKIYTDLAWVYEYYLSPNSYQAEIVDTDVQATYNQKTPAKSYGRAILGLIGRRKKMEWELTYTGLFGKSFVENAGSFKLSTKF